MPKTKEKSHLSILYQQTTIHGKRAKSMLIFKHLELHKSFFSPSKQPDS